MTLSTLPPTVGKPLGWMGENHVPLLLIATLALFPFGTSHQLPLAILALIGLYRVFRADTAAWKRPELKLFLGVYALICIPLLISMLDAVNMGKTIGTTVRYAAFLFIGLAVLLDRPARRIGPVLLWGLLIIPTVWVFDGLVQHFWGTNLLGYPPDRGQITGLFYPRRSIGIFLAHLAPFYLEALRRLSPGRPWLWLLLIPLVAVILLSGVRSAWLTMLLTLAAYGVYLVVIYRISWKRVAAVGTTLAIAVIIVAMFSPRLEHRLDKTVRLMDLDFNSWNYATSGRMAIWSAAIRVFQDHWVNGVGARGLMPQALESGYLRRDFSHAHLFALEIPVTTGVIGLAGYLAILGILLAWYARLGVHRAALFAPWLALGLILFPLNAHWHFYGTFATALLWFIFLVTMIMTREELRPMPAMNGRTGPQDQAPPATSSR